MNSHTKIFRIDGVERKAQKKWNTKKISTSMITLRHELIAYYEQRGYHRKGYLASSIRTHVRYPQGCGLAIQISGKHLS